MSLNKNFSFLESEPWFKNDNSIALLSTLTLKRNLKSHLFPHKLDDQYILDLSERLAAPLIKCSSTPQLETLTANSLSPLQKQLIYEHFFTSHNFSHVRNNESILIDPKGVFLSTLNIEDHLHLHYLDPRGNLEESWNYLLNIENNLSNEIEFAYSSKFGFLTSIPQFCGTGLTIKNILHLPALIKTSKLQTAIANINTSTISISSLTGSLKSTLGNIILVHNRQTCGQTEEALLKSVREATLKLTIAERAERKAISSGEDNQLKSLVSKAFGILKHGFEIDVQEALNELSLIKFGVELNWIDGISLLEINELFFSIRKGRLSLTLKDRQQIDQVRANVIQKKLKKARCHL